LARLRWAGGALCGALVACLVYAGDRTAAAILAPVDPRVVVESARIDYFWRAGMSAFVGSLALLLFVQLTRGHEATALRWVTHAAPVVVGISVLLSVVWP